MNKDEIKKALQCCSSPRVNSCDDCPYNSGDCVDGKMKLDALNIITEQEKEIDALKEKCEELRNEKEIDALKEKCEELRNEKWDAQDDLDCYFDEMLNKIKQAKIKAIKEFAEKLKARITKFIWRHNIPECIFNDIMSDLLKEYEKTKN